MSAVQESLGLAVQASRLWRARSTVPMDQAACTVALVPAAASVTSGTFCFVGLGTHLEDLDRSGVTAFDLTGDRPTALPDDELFGRFVQGQVGVLVNGGSPASSPAGLPSRFVAAREALRHQQMYARFLVFQIALDEMTGSRGAARELVDELVAAWSVPLAISMDLAVLFTLGADRQRYVSEDYRDTLLLRRKALLRHLADQGVSSNPLLAV